VRFGSLDRRGAGESEVVMNAFGTVLITVVIVSVVIGAVIVARYGLFGQRWRGEEWMFHGEADTVPHAAPGMSLEERHVIDPEPVAPIEPRQGLIAPGSRMGRGRHV
jgi:aspartate aminotransferase-like enzyme